MPKKRYTDEQIAFALRQAEAGTPVGEICRKMGVTEATYYRWRKAYAGMGVAEIRRLKQLEGERPPKPTWKGLTNASTLNGVERRSRAAARRDG